MSKRRKFSAPLTVFLAIVCAVFGCGIGVLGMGVYDALTYESDHASVLVEGEMQIHFLELGNKYTGDCVYIKAGETDILIDAGSRADSAATISAYINDYVTDNKLEYVIVTHAHQDHYAGFATRNGSIFDLYECETIIDFAQTNQKLPAEGKTNMYGNYLAELADEVAAGATHYTAAECVSQGKDTFDLGNGITMKVLDNKYYYEKSSTENNYSVCILFTYGEHNYLFTGDLEGDGEAELVRLNDLPQVELYKAGHHGSKTSSTDALLSVIQPEIVCVCCCTGSPEYTGTDANQFPTQAFIDRIAVYTDRVYVTTLCVDYDAGTFTSMNGNIVVVTDAAGVHVTCSNADTVLKDWQWFRDHRETPTKWK